MKVAQNKALSIFFIFILIFSISFTSANAAAVIAQHQAQAQQKINYQNINAPFDFAKNNSCILKYPPYMDTEVGKFLCEAKDGTWVLRTNGAGNITNSYFNSNEVIYFDLGGNLLGIAIILLIGFFVFTIITREKKK
jgi:hypothetical protein